MNGEQRPGYFAHAQDLTAHFAHARRHVFACRGPYYVWGSSFSLKWTKTEKKKKKKKKNIANYLQTADSLLQWITHVRML